MDVLEQIKQSIIVGHVSADAPYPPGLEGEPGTIELIDAALSRGLEVITILNAGLIAGMDDVGDKFTGGEYFLPHMLMSAQGMKAGMKILDPLLKEQGAARRGKVIMGTVKGDMHDIGKNLVAVVLEGAGFEIVDLGVDIANQRFVDECQAAPKAVVGMSALLTTTKEAMRDVIALLREHDLQNKVVVGGAAVNRQFAEEIGADGYARDAIRSVAVVRELSITNAA